VWKIWPLTFYKSGEPPDQHSVGEGGWLVFVVFF